MKSNCFINLFSPSVVDLILQHFTTGEILQTSIVDKLWNEFISRESIIAWRNTYFVIEKEEAIYDLSKSYRRYQHLDITINSNRNFDLIASLEIVIVSRKWKSLIFRDTVITMDGMRKILEYCHETVETLELYVNKLSHFQSFLLLFKNQGLTFPQLKNFKLLFPQRMDLNLNCVQCSGAHQE